MRSLLKFDRLLFSFCELRSYSFRHDDIKFELVDPDTGLMAEMEQLFTRIETSVLEEIPNEIYR